MLIILLFLAWIGKFVNFWVGNFVGIGFSEKSRSKRINW